MIISRTPFRLSFFGGGTDYPGWYLKHGGQVLSTAINKYCYITLRHLPPFFEHRIRLVYSRMEHCNHLSEIKHPAVRETLRFLDFDRNLEIHHDGDLPARSGMGSSSSFTVGLLHAIYALKGVMVSPEQLAKESLHIEQEMIQETVGSQDQVAAAYGGMNHIIFHKSGKIEVRPVTLNHTRRHELSEHLMLFYTGIMRTASQVAETYVENLGAKAVHLRAMSRMVNEGISILYGGQDIRAFGTLMHEAWLAKKMLGDKVTNPVVDALYERARANGAIGGKLLGAGGGGFLCLFVPPTKQQRVREEFKELLHVPFRFADQGSQIIFFTSATEDYRNCERGNNPMHIEKFKEL